MNFIKKNKILLIVLAVILIIGIAIAFYFLTKDTNTSVNDLEIKYINGEEINIKNPNSSYEETKEITITNTSKDLKTYSLEWIKVSNNFNDQSKLLYEITGKGERAASLGTSQVPSVNSKIFNSVAIKAGDTHTYKVKITYKGKEVSNNSFYGALKINSEKPKTDTKKENGIPYKEKEENKTKDTKDAKKDLSKKA